MQGAASQSPSNMGREPGAPPVLVCTRTSRGASPGHAKRGSHEKLLVRKRRQRLSFSSATPQIDPFSALVLRNIVHLDPYGLLRTDYGVHPSIPCSASPLGPVFFTVAGGASSLASPLHPPPASLASSVCVCVCVCASSFSPAPLLLGSRSTSRCSAGLFLDRAFTRPSPRFCIASHRATHHRGLATASSGSLVIVNKRLPAAHRQYAPGRGIRSLPASRDPTRPASPHPHARRHPHRSHPSWVSR